MKIILIPSLVLITTMSLSAVQVVEFNQLQEIQQKSNSSIEKIKKDILNAGFTKEVALAKFKKLEINEQMINNIESLTFLTLENISSFITKRSFQNKKINFCEYQTLIALAQSVKIYINQEEIESLVKVSSLNKALITV